MDGVSADSLGLNGFRAIVSPGRIYSPGFSWRLALGPLAVIIAVDLYCSYALRPFMLHVGLNAVPVELRAGMASQFDAAMRMVMVGALVRPVAFALVWAALLFVVLGTCGHVVRFTRLLAAITCAALVMAAKGGFATLLLTLRGVDAIEHAADLEPRVGLGFLVSSPSAVVANLIDSVNVFDIWFIVILTIALMQTERLSKRVAGTVVVASWCVMLCARLGFQMLSQR